MPQLANQIAGFHSAKWPSGMGIQCNIISLYIIHSQGPIIIIRFIINPHCVNRRRSELGIGAVRIELLHYATLKRLVPCSLGTDTLWIVRHVFNTSISISSSGIYIAWINLSCLNYSR